MTSLPLPGYQVSSVSDGTAADDDARFVVSHLGSQQTYYFDADNSTTRHRFCSVSTQCQTGMWVIVADKLSSAKAIAGNSGPCSRMPVKFYMTLLNVFCLGFRPISLYWSKS